jgi:hypothetical protein
MFSFSIIFLQTTAENNVDPQVQDILEAKENGSSPTSALIQALSYLPGWAEKNFQVWCP